MAYRGSYDDGGGFNLIWVVIIVVAVFVLFSGPLNGYDTRLGCLEEYTECTQDDGDGYWYPSDDAKVVED